jgi:WD40 repeat protein
MKAKDQDAVETYKFHTKAVNAVAYTGQYFISGSSDSQIKIWF